MKNWLWTLLKLNHLFIIKQLHWDHDVCRMRQIKGLNSVRAAQPFNVSLFLCEFLILLRFSFCALQTLIREMEKKEAWINSKLIFPSTQTAIIYVKYEIYFRVPWLVALFFLFRESILPPAFADRVSLSLLFQSSEYRLLWNTKGAASRIEKLHRKWIL